MIELYLCFLCGNNRLKKGRHQDVAYSLEISTSGLYDFEYSWSQFQALFFRSFIC